MKTVLLEAAEQEAVRRAKEDGEDRLVYFNKKHGLRIVPVESIDDVPAEEKGELISFARTDGVIESYQGKGK